MASEVTIRHWHSVEILIDWLILTELRFRLGEMEPQLRQEDVSLQGLEDLCYDSTFVKARPESSRLLNHLECNLTHRDYWIENSTPGDCSLHC